MKCFRTLLGVATLALLPVPTGCGGAATNGASSAPARPSAPTSPRELADGASYQDLVGRARALEGESPPDESRCIARATTSGLLLASELVPAVRPLPDAPADLDARLEGGGTPTFAALTRWGRTGTGSLVLVAFTPVAPILDGEPLLAVLLGRRGVYLRSTAGAVAPAQRGPFPLETLGAHLDSLGDDSVPVLVAADATTTVATLRRALEALRSHGRRAALASVLPASTRLPEPLPTPANVDAGLCETLPDLPSTVAEGSLPVEAIRRGMEPLRDAVPRCAAASASSHVARGGRLGLLVRIAGGGTVEAACARQDTIGDSAFRACVLEGARALRFDRPAPEGVVDVAFPLVVAPDSSHERDALCD